MERFLRWSAKIQLFLKGRYARNDQLNQLLLKISVVIWLLNFFFTNLFLRVVLFTFISVYMYRFLSKRIYVRLNENQKYLTIRQQLGVKFEMLKRKRTDGYRYFKCPSCHQKLRAPKGRGKIKVTCSHCQQKFVKKV